ncbi:MAG: hypothetical protein K8J08_18240 [Thermoanaerobaculia bacterium]|nr:hypothetical protein [Thermoanaerobaculia bacterium]
MDRSPLIEQVLSGTNRPLMLLAARGLLPVAPAELVQVQVHLASQDDIEIAEASKQSLASLQGRFVVPLIHQDADARVLRYFAQHSRDGEVLSAIIRRRDVPIDLLFDLAPRIPADLQEVFLLRQDRISAVPDLLEALERNPALTNYAHRRIAEYRTHLLEQSAQVIIQAEVTEASLGEVEEASDEEVIAAIESVRQAPVEGDVDEQTGLSDGQIRLLPIPVRLKLTRGASKTLRNLLIRDNNTQVALSVLQNNPMSDQEIEHLSRSRSVVEDVLEYIGRQRRWVQKYPIAVGLVSNPRTPLGLSVRLVPRLSVRDLRNLGRDRNVPEAVRSTAQRIYRVKSK